MFEVLGVRAVAPERPTKLPERSAFGTMLWQACYNAATQHICCAHALKEGGDRLGQCKGLAAVLRACHRQH
eukprot:scaffold87117_cov19-Tisochrysis_lutea.AAC.3